MKVSSILLAVLFLFASNAWSDLYQWTDRDGVVHITDSLESVPQEYRAKVKVHESGPPAEEAAPAPEAPEGMAPQPGPEDRLYGGHTEEWWRQAFRIRREQIDQLAAGIETKEQFVETFEGGRRFGQIFGQEKVDAYEAYKEQLPDDKERLTELKAELEKLEKEARIEDVPREIWERKE